MAKAKKDGAIGWQIWVAGVIISVIIGLMAVQWQSSVDNAEQNEERILKLDAIHTEDFRKTASDHDVDVARLDESNRNRRNQIADLEERIAILEERTK